MAPLTSQTQSKQNPRELKHFIRNLSSSIQRKVTSLGIAVALACVALTLPVSSKAQATEPAAIVNGQKITLQEVDATIATQIFPLKQQLYSLRKAALSNLILAKVLEDEAVKRKLSIEELRKQLMVGEVLVTKAEVDEAYKQNAPLFALMSAHEAKERLRLDLESQQRMRLFRTAIEGLKSRAEISLWLEEPSFPVKLDDGGSPIKGATKPLVTVVEFSDFQCPFCKQVQPTLKLIMDKYAAQVKLVFKYLPLESHQNSLQAAVASYCAGEQNKFWEFHDALFSSTGLTNTELLRYAHEVGLDPIRFQKCQSSDRPRTAIANDLEKARILRIESTPSFVINGRVVTGAIGYPEFQQLVDRAMGQTSLKPTSTN